MGSELRCIIRKTHICGHESTRKTVKCLQAILTQLNLADENVFDCNRASNKWECLHEADLPREYIKPGICERCKRTGLVASFFEHDPSIEYDILREWQAHKRASKANEHDIERESDWDETRTPQSWTQHSLSSGTSRGPETPESEMLISGAVFTNFNNAEFEGTSETLSPILCKSICRIDSAESKENNAVTSTDAEPKASVESREEKEKGETS